MRFVCSSPAWHLSGVNTFFGNLFEAARQKEHRTEVILTETNGRPPPLSLPEDIGITEFPPTRWGAVRQRQKRLFHELTSRAPCVYFPNYDFNHAPVIEVLPPEVAVIPIAHSDEYEYYDFIRRYGHAADAIIAVSETIERHIREEHPEWSAKLRRIPYGVPIPDTLQSPVKAERENLEIVYSGRLSQVQKRIFDLVEVILQCRRDRLAVRFTLAGSGPEEEEVARRLKPAIDDGFARLPGTLPRKEMETLLDSADAVILTSEYEGLPLILLEAMARGCVPVVSRIESGIDEVIKHGESGITVPIGDIAGFTEACRSLASDTNRRETLRQNAVATIRGGPYDIKQTAEAYEKLAMEAALGQLSPPAKRRTGNPKIPAHYTFRYRANKRLRRLLKRR